MNFIKITLAGIYILLCAVSAKAQRITVLDRSELSPIDSVHILTKEGVIITATDMKGTAMVPQGIAYDTIILIKPGYQRLKIGTAAINSGNYTAYMTDNVLVMDEVVYSANRNAENKQDVPAQIEVISRRNISFANPQTAGDMLVQSGKVFMQQSQLGGGSPVLRGFEANKVLMVIDGVRMNNAIYRGGHLQNVITIDPNMLERTEVVFGPNSVMYGSDALGGVMHFITRNPQFNFSDSDAVNFMGNAYQRYSTAAGEYTAHADLNIGLRKIAFLTSITHKNLGDLRMGNIRDPFYTDFGKRTEYADRINGRDTILKNEDPNVQKGTGYKQYDIMQKIAFMPGKKSLYTLNVQYSSTSDIPRYDRLTQYRNGSLRFAEWYYGPQDRLLASLKATYYDAAIFDQATIIAAYQQIEESRIDRAFGKADKSHRIENVDVTSLNADFLKRIRSKFELRYGLEASLNKVRSKALKENIITGEKSPLDTRYPGGGSSMNFFGAYLSNNWEISPKVIFSQGLRYSLVTLDASFGDTTFYKFPVDKVEQSNGALSGNLGLVLLPGNDFKISLLASTGFRAPNVDDLSKVFESAPGLVIVPNAGLEPEYTYNGEIGLGKTFDQKVNVNGNVFYTLYRNAIVTRPARFNGQDSIVYGGALSQVQQNVNASQAYLYGGQAEVNAQITQAFSLSSSLTYTYGRVVEDDMPLDHIPPVFGQTSLKLELKKFRSEFFVRYNGWKRLKDYSASGEDNLNGATAYGMPAWYTLNLRTQYNFSRTLALQAGLENILDVHYRYFASGVSAPGRNLYVTLRASF